MSKQKNFEKSLEAKLIAEKLKDSFSSKPLKAYFSIRRKDEYEILIQATKENLLDEDFSLSEDEKELWYKEIPIIYEP